VSGPVPIQSCRRARTLVLRALDGELSLEGRLGLEAHLARCADCARFEAQATSVEESLRASGEPDNLREIGSVVEGVLAALDRPARGEERPARSWRRRAAGLAAAAALVLGGFALWRALAPREESPSPSDPSTGAVADLVLPVPVPAIAVPEPETAPVPPGEVAPDSGEPTPDPDEPARIAELVRENLRAAFGGELLVRDPLPGVQRFESLSSSIRSWPLARVAESLLVDPDTTVAAGAARYLGARGDRLSVPRLAAVLREPEVGAATVLALGDFLARDPDASAIALDGLRTALADPELCPLALDVLGERGGAGAARALEEGLRDELARRAVDGRGPASVPEREAWLAALARSGPAAVASFLRLAGDGAPDVLGYLARIEGAEGELVRILERQPTGVPREVLPDAIDVLQPAAALAWLEDRAGEPRHRPRALACLSGWRRAAAVGAFLRLDELGTVREEELLASFRAFAETRGDLLREAVGHLERNGDDVGLGRYLELLLASGSPSASGALVRLARSPALASGARSRAALGVGELGGAEEARALLAVLGEEPPAEREILASILITAWRALEPDEVRASFGVFTARGARRVEEALVEISNRGAGPVALARVSRALQGAFVPRNPDTQRLL
jgi:hypothetical protein